MTGEWYYICDKCGNIVTIEAAPLKNQGSWLCDECGASALWEFDNRTNALIHSATIRERRVRDLS